MAFLILFVWFVLAYLLQLHVLPVWGWVLTTPELLLTVSAVGGRVYGMGRTLPFALLFGAAADLTLGFGYGGFLIPMTAAVMLFHGSERLSSERPYAAALATGAAAMLARLFRACIQMILGHGFFPAGREWLAIAGSGLFSALAALILMIAAEHRSRREREGRYRL